MKKEQTKYSRLSSCKKIISAILSVTALLTMSVTTASATLTDGDFNYEVNEDGTVEITEYLGNEEDTLVLPDEIDGKIVTSIGYHAFCKNSPSDPVDISYVETFNFKHITLPQNLKKIGPFAFAGCKNLENLIIPNTVTSIDNYAFFDCKSLKNIKFSNSLECIGAGAFKRIGVESIYIPNSIKKIDDRAFLSCTSLKTVVLPNGDFFIAEKAFGYWQAGMNDGLKVTNPNFPSIYMNDFKIYGYTGTDAERYALENEFDFVAIDESVSELTDNTTGIIMNGEFDYDTELNVVEVTPTQENSIKEYEITLVKNGEVVQPNGEITISIPNKTANCKVLWIKEDGTAEDMNAIYENGYYVFNTNHLSIYSVVEQKENPTEKPSQEPTQDSTDEPTNPTVEPTQPVTEPTDPTDIPNPTDNPTNPTTPTDNPTNKPNSNIITNNTTGKTAGTVNTGDTSFIFVALMVIGVAGTATFIVRKVKYSK